MLREYALLADGERGVLIGPKGELAWMCAPHWDSDAVFSSLIGGKGLYAITPTDTRFVWGGYYEEGSLIWHSRWVTTTGIIECREALAFPADPHTAVVLRRVTAVDERARTRVILDVRAGFGSQDMTDIRCHRGIWTARSGPLYLRWSGGEGADRRPDGALTVTVELEPGCHHDLVLEISDHALAEPVEARAAWEVTEAAWARAVPDLGETLAPRDARHGYAVLRGLTSAGGGMVAAASMSLPERAEQGRNYDYRYAWIRDQCYTGQAVSVDRPLPLLDDAVAFVAERILADGPQLKPAYRIDGSAVPDERRLRHLAGYPGGTDKVGNRVNHQFQLDVLGEALLLFACAARHDHLDSEHWRAVETTVAAIESRWGHPDAGIWELDNQRWAHSRLTCVAGLRTIADATGTSRWTRLADAILADVGSDCVHPSGRWQRSPTDDRIDAALLLPAIRGALSPNDPRSLATLDAVDTELERDGYVYRFRQDERPLEEAEGAFLLCGFLMALARHQHGRPAEAMASFERNRAACGPSGLFTEEYDVRQRQQRGNIPQAFVHALLLECGARLSRPWVGS
ncbi:MAG TPA: glycoside hydrolase family 15 protein [Acidimicrobiales bacterium]|nr:glycoside hydrolase family 15 protein [Acidimicrobiales bacterium]